MQIKYDNQDQEWENCLSIEEKKLHASQWLKKNTLDYWRHKRMLSTIKPFIKKDEKWLTIGDGRYGTEANFLISNGANALATDYSDKLLKISKEIGFINEYKNRGGRVTAGSDSGFIFQLYGFAYIRELELLREAGFHPLEVIRAATLNGAEALGMDNEIGSI